MCARESCGFVVRTPEGEQYQPCVIFLQSRRRIFVLRRKTGCGRYAGGDCGAGPQSSRRSALADEADRRLQVKSAIPWWLVCRAKFIISAAFRTSPDGVLNTVDGLLHPVPGCIPSGGDNAAGFAREDDWWRNGQNLYLDNLGKTAFTGYPCPVHRREIFCCLFWFIGTQSCCHLLWQW